MKYDFDTDMTVIKDYRICDGKIVVNYLNGYQLEEPYSKEKEQDLKDYMVFQAEERDETISIEKIENARQRKILLAELMASTNIALLVNSFIQEGYQKNALYLAAVGVSFIYSLHFCGEAVENHDKVKELEKYRLYLKMRKFLNESDSLNINTLDDYSLSDVKKLDKKLKKERK